MPQKSPAEMQIEIGTPLYRVASLVNEKGESADSAFYAGDICDLLALVDGKGFESISSKVGELKPGVSVTLPCGEVQKLISAVKKAAA